MKTSEIHAGNMIKTKMDTFRSGQCGTVIEVYPWGVELMFEGGLRGPVESWKWYELEVIND